MTKAQDVIGKHGQNLAASTLAGLGIEMVEPIGTPIKAIPVLCGARKNVYQVIWGDKVAGDHRGLMPGGRSVLVETKTILDHNLTWSDFRDHQPEKLSQHHSIGGLSLVVWVHEEIPSGIYVMEWPIVGFGPGKGISPEVAKIWDEITRATIQHDIDNSPR